MIRSVNPGLFYFIRCKFYDLTDRARDTQNNEIVAMKKMRMEQEKDGKYDSLILLMFLERLNYLLIGNIGEE